mgnify:CR=1 FL=1
MTQDQINNLPAFNLASLPSSLPKGQKITIDGVVTGTDENGFLDGDVLDSLDEAHDTGIHGDKFVFVIDDDGEVVNHPPGHLDSLAASDQP